MRLRLYVLLLLLLTVGLTMGLFAIQSHHAVNSAFLSLESTRVRYISEILKSALDAQKQSLVQISRILRSDNDLSATYVLASESRDAELLKRKIDRVRKGIDADFIDVLSEQGTPLLNERLAMGRDEVAAVLSKNEDEVGVTQLDQRPFVYSLSPLKLYETTVGVLFIGSFLDGKPREQVSQMTGSQIDFVVGEPVRGTPAFRVLESEAKIPLWATIKVENEGAPIADKLFSSLLWVTGLCLLGLSLASYFLLHLGFLKGLSSIIRKIERYNMDLELGHLTSLNLGSFHIRENQLLSLSFGKLSESLARYSSRLKEQKELESQAERQKALSELSTQVAHDIRSPLAALSMMISNLPQIPERKKMLLKGALSRITGICNELLEQYRDQKGQSTVVAHLNALQPELIPALIESIVWEKREQLRNASVQIQVAMDPNQEVFAPVDRVQFARVLSNLIDNGVEAGPKDDQVVVEMETGEKTISIFVRDSGVGIPSTIVEQLGRRGASYGKGCGLGLGLHHAIKSIESWGGKLKITSVPGGGTTVTIQLPRVPKPQWLAQEIAIRRGTTVAILDDEPLIHEVWRTKFAESARQGDVQLVHFFSGQSLSEWKAQQDANGARITYLVDFELGRAASDRDGLSLVEELGIASSSVLVTGRFEDSLVRNRCVSLGVPLLPKSMVDRVAIAWIG